jgi:hypothetical protein
MQIEPAAGVSRLACAELIGHLLALARVKNVTLDTERLAKEAVGQLREALAHDSVTIAQIEQSVALTPLRSRQDYRELVAGKGQ